MYDIIILDIQNINSYWREFSMARPKEYDNKIRLTLSTDYQIRERLRIVSIRSDKNVNQLINEGIDLVFDEYEKQGIYSDLHPHTSTKERHDMIQSDGQERKTAVITITNNKGGVAKTTTCASLAVVASKKKKRVLVIDLDIQMNTSDLMGYPIGSTEPNVANYLETFFDAQMGTVDIKNYILPTRYKNVDVMISSPKMQVNFEQTLQTVSSNRGDLVGRMIKNIKKLGLYDYVFIDTQPSMGIIVTSTYKESDWLIIPTEPEKYGIEGSVKVCNFVNTRIMDELPVAKIAGIVFVKTDERTALAKAIPAFRQQLEEMGAHCFQTTIPHSADVPKARMNGCAVTDLYPLSKPSLKYIELFKELEEVIQNG